MRIARWLPVLLIAITGSGQTTSPRRVFFRVRAAASISVPVSGRLLIFLKKGSGDNKVDSEEFHPEDTWVTAREVEALAPGKSIEVDGGEIAFPKPFSELPAGDYEAQAVLDVNHSYNYGGRNPADWISGVTALTHWTPGEGSEPVFELDRHPQPNAERAARLDKARSEAKPDIARLEEMTSPLLTRFWGHPVQIRSWVILPPGYTAGTGVRFPTVYWTHGFGGTLEYSLGSGLSIRKRMDEKKMPSMIWVMLDESIPQGTHEFADSVNDGPWGSALTTEFIPYLEKKYRMDARPSGRLLNGHSSGGWATLQLQINYPQVFGGTWSTSPDPSDFHDFTGVDLYAPHANLYTKPDGSPVPLMRDKGKVMATFEEFAKLEAVLGSYGGQISSFNWVFSPKSASGAPQPMFNRETGTVYPQVVAYWHDHYDLAHLVEEKWSTQKRLLRSRIHLIVGTADTFYLDGSARKLEAVLKRLDADAHFTYIPDRTHFDLYAVGTDREALFDRIAIEMYAVARPAPSREFDGHPKAEAETK
jgi:putative esterase